jgi:hypothetical protein
MVAHVPNGEAGVGPDDQSVNLHYDYYLKFSQLLTVPPLATE